jgi:hypothetical protein
LGEIQRHAIAERCGEAGFFLGGQQRLATPRGLRLARSAEV